MRYEAITGALELSVAERIQLVEDIWDSIAQVPGSLRLSTAQKAELDRRLAAYHANPSLGSPWETVLKRLRKAL